MIKVKQRNAIASSALAQPTIILCTPIVPLKYERNKQRRRTRKTENKEYPFSDSQESIVILSSKPKWKSEYIEQINLDKIQHRSCRW